MLPWLFFIISQGPATSLDSLGPLIAIVLAYALLLRLICTVLAADFHHG